MLVAADAGAEVRHALAAQDELFAGLRTFGQLDLVLAADDWNFDGPAERGLGKAHVHRTVEIIVVPLKDFVLFHDNDNVKVAGGTAERAGIAFAGKMDPAARVDTGRDAQCALVSPANAPVGTLSARIRDQSSGAAASSAGLDASNAHKRDPLRIAHFAGAIALGTGFGLCARRRAGTTAVGADFHPRIPNGGLGTEHGVFQRDLNLVGQVVSAKYRGTRSSARGLRAVEHRVDVAEYIFRRAESAGESARAAVQPGPRQTDRTAAA